MRIKKFNNRRLLALLVCVCIAAVFLLSEWFIFTHADHDCTGEHCSVCAQIHTLENLLKQLGLAPIIVMAAFFNSFAAFALVNRGNIHAAITPITLKVRMNN